MKIIKNFLIAFFVLLISNNAFSQNNIVNDADFSPPNSALQNGKIIVQTHTNQESITLALNLVRWAGSESKQLEAEGYFILDINSSELILSDVVTFSNSDFSPSSAIISQPKFIPITFKANLVKIGAVKFKFREKTNGAWTAYRYSSKNFNTAYYIPPVVTPVTEITGPDNLCTEATYTITNPGTISLENAAGIGTLTALGNNQWKVTRTGQGNGTVILKSINSNGQATAKNIIIGTMTSGTISGQASLQLGESRTFTLNLLDNTDYIWSINYNPNVILTKNSATSITLSTTGSVPMGWSENIIIRAKAVNNCGTATNEVTKTIKFVNERDPRLD